MQQLSHTSQPCSYHGKLEDRRLYNKQNYTSNTQKNYDQLHTVVVFSGQSINCRIKKNLRKEINI